MTHSPPWGYYAALHADKAASIIDAVPIAYLPWGALEWHGPHLPLGTENYIAEAFVERLAQRVGGLIFPTTWLPITAMPHRFSISIRSDILHELWDALFAEMARIGFQVAVVISGHASPAHELVLIDAAERAISTHHLNVLAVSPLAFIDPTMHDHAAHWETALMLALQPQLTALERLDGLDLTLENSGIIGDNPLLATVGQGESALRLATERLAVSIHALLDQDSQTILNELYHRRRNFYNSYVNDFFRGSWEESAAAWWRQSLKGNGE